MFHQLVQKAAPILLFLDEKQANHPKISISNVNDIKIDDLLDVQPLTIEAVVKGPEVMEELEKDLMVEKIIIHAICYYFVGVQLKHVSSEESMIESSIFLSRAWKICNSFLPAESEIYNSIGSVWSKCKKIGVNRVRSISRIKPPGKGLKSEARSASNNKFRQSPLKRLNDTAKDPLLKHSEQSLLPLRKKIFGKGKRGK